MRAVCQRVVEARVRVEERVVGEIGAGLCVLLGVAVGDRAEQASALAGKIARLRIFPDEAGRFDRSLVDAGGGALVVSQFTLLADTAKGNRPSFTGAAPPEGRSRSTSGSARSCARSVCRWSRECSARRWPWSSSTTGP